MTYEEAVVELESRNIMPDREVSLEPTREGLRRIGFEKHVFKKNQIILVGGTNGKGSVSATLEALLIATGERVGLYTSPHLVSTTERIRVQGLDVTREVFTELYKEVSACTKDLGLSHFECLTLMAAHYFFSEKHVPSVDRAIFEVGLGGRWDATNALPHDFNILTSIGLDHQNILGSTLAEIASEKLGIIGAGSTVVSSPWPQQLESQVLERIRLMHAKFVRAESFKFAVGHPDSSGEPEFWIDCKWGQAHILLPGLRGAENSMTALSAFAELGFQPQNFLSALKSVRWPGRMQKVNFPASPCPLYLSGDHNIQGAESLVELLRYFKRKRLHLLVGIGRDKDADAILSILTKLENTSYYLTETPFRGRTIEQYGKWKENAAGADANAIAAIKQIAAAADPEDLIVVTGSLYLVGHILGFIERLFHNQIGEDRFDCEAASKSSR